MASLAIFNLLPTAIFDGGRMVKEIISLLVGNKMYDLHAHKRLHYEFNNTDPKQHLMTQSVQKVIMVQELIPVNVEKKNSSINLEDETTFKLRELEFISHDTSTDGYIDTIELKVDETLQNKSFIEVEVEYEQDLKAPLKKKIYKSISWTIGLMLLASFVISIVKFNNTLFWL